MEPLYKRCMYIMGGGPLSGYCFVDEEPVESARRALERRHSNHVSTPQCGCVESSGGRTAMPSCFHASMALERDVRRLLLRSETREEAGGDADLLFGRVIGPRLSVAKFPSR
jgi:hypothetical protein